jgi:hypothetical protein
MERNRVRLLEFNLSKGHSIEVINVSTNQKTLYPTVRQAASELGVSHLSVLRVLKSKKLIKATYRINYANNNNS